MELSFKERMQLNAFGSFKKFNAGKDIELQSTCKEEYRELGRFYQTPPDGKWYPSITTVLSILSKDAINEWRKRVGEEEANRITQEASARGTRVHKICENYISGNHAELTNLNFADLQTFKNIKSILDQNMDNIRAQEIGLFSHELECAGRTDTLADWRSKLSIIDFKTSKKQKKEEWIQNYFQQIAGYAFMLKEMTGEVVEQGVIIISSDKGMPQVFTFDPFSYIDDFRESRRKYKELYGV